MPGPQLTLYKNLAGISPALKTPRRGVFAPRDAGRGARAFRFPHGSPFTLDTY